MNKKIIGNWGEMIAKNYLEKNNYKILETNWHHGHYELDIIAFKFEIVGIEVKTRGSLNNPPFTVLKPEQLSRLRQTLAKYCQIKGLSYNDSRIDLILLSKKNKNTIKISHYHHI